MMKKKLNYRQIIINRMPYQFIHFLIINNCFTEYVDELLNRCETYYGLNKESHIDHIFNNDGLYFIERSFVWGETVRGFNYWLNINGLWRRFYKLKTS